MIHLGKPHRNAADHPQQVNERTSSLGSLGEQVRSAAIPRHINGTNHATNTIDLSILDRTVSPRLPPSSDTIYNDSQITQESNTSTYSSPQGSDKLLARLFSTARRKTSGLKHSIIHHVSHSTPAGDISQSGDLFRHQTHQSPAGIVMDDNEAPATHDLLLYRTASDISPVATPIYTVQEQNSLRTHPSSSNEKLESETRTIAHYSRVPTARDSAIVEPMWQVEARLLDILNLAISLRVDLLSCNGDTDHPTLHRYRPVLFTMSWLDESPILAKYEQMGTTLRASDASRWSAVKSLFLQSESYVCHHPAPAALAADLNRLFEAHVKEHMASSPSSSSSSDVISSRNCAVATISAGISDKMLLTTARGIPETVIKHGDRMCDQDSPILSPQQDRMPTTPQHSLQESLEESPEDIPEDTFEDALEETFDANFMVHKSIPFLHTNVSEADSFMTAHSTRLDMPPSPDNLATYNWVDDVTRHTRDDESPGVKEENKQQITFWSDDDSTAVMTWRKRIDSIMTIPLATIVKKSSSKLRSSLEKASHRISVSVKRNKSEDSEQDAPRKAIRIGSLTGESATTGKEHSGTAFPSSRLDAALPASDPDKHEAERVDWRTVDRAVNQTRERQYEHWEADLEMETHLRQRFGSEIVETVLVSHDYQQAKTIKAPSLRKRLECHVLSAVEALCADEQEKLMRGFFGDKVYDQNVFEGEVPQLRKEFLRHSSQLLEVSGLGPTRNLVQEAQVLSTMPSTGPSSRTYAAPAQELTQRREDTQALSASQPIKTPPNNPASASTNVSSASYSASIDHAIGRNFRRKTNPPP